MPSAAVAGHYEIFNALQNKTNKTVKALAFLLRNVNRCKNERRRHDKHLKQKILLYLRIYIVQF